MRPTLKKLYVAVLAAFAAPAFAQSSSDDAVKELTQPKSTAEAGAIYVSQDSQKFGEYNGLWEKGWYPLVNLYLYGGNPDTAYRWRIFGTDLGLDTRTLGFETGEQGRWRLFAGYDGIPHRYAYGDNYVTLWNGAGSNTLTLPAGYPAAATRLGVTNNAAGLLSNWNNIQTPNATATGGAGAGPAFVIPANLHPFDVGTMRHRGNFAGSYIFAPGLEFKVNYRHEEKDGTKLTGVAFGGQRGALLPEHIDSTTDNVEAYLSWVFPKGNVQVGYYGSVYRNNTNLWTAENPFATNDVWNNVARMSGAPDNQMHQFNASGGYNFTNTMRLMFSGAWSKLTQNEQFIDIPAGSNWSVPVTSANAKVNNVSLLGRFIARPMKDLDTTLNYKYDDRDNKTPTNSFLTSGADGTGAPSLFTNEPNHRRITQWMGEANWRFAKGQGLVGTYEWTEIQRHGTTYDETPFRAEKTTENLVRAEYRNMLNDVLTGRVSYAYSRRKPSEYEDGNPAPVNPPAPLPGADPLLPGFRQFWLADRDRDKLRAALNWQASEVASLQGSLDYNRDRYTNSPYGLQKAQSWSFTLDGAYQANDALTFNAFYTYEDQKADLSSLAISRGLSTTILVPHDSSTCASYTNVSGRLPTDYYTDPCRQWSYNQGDTVHTVGGAFRYRGFMKGKIELAGDLSYSYAKTALDISGGAYYNNGVPNSPTGNGFIAATSPPNITSEMTSIRLFATYAIDRVSAVRFMYQYAHLNSKDFQYDAFTNSSLGPLALQAYIGNGMTSPNYNVNVVAVSYVYRFK